MAETEKYRFVGMKDESDQTNMIVSKDASGENVLTPLKEVIELDAESAQRLKDAGHKLIKLSEEQAEKIADSDVDKPASIAAPADKKK